MIAFSELQSLDINILSCHDLADVTVSRSALYRILRSLYKKEYQHKDRIVFYTTCEIPETLWKHLYRATDKVDVSNYFILVCSTKDISSIAQQQALKWAQSGVPFQTQVVADFNSRLLDDNYSISDTVCPMLWSHLEIRNDGSVYPCCVFKGSIGNIAQGDQLTEIFTGHQINSIRQELLNNNQPTGCRACWKNEKNGVVSNRQRHLDFLGLDFFSEYIDNPKLISLDLKPGNTCNFKCRICGPNYSSLWAQEKATVQSIPVIRHRWAESNNQIFDQIYDHIPTITNYDLYGGEPFLIKPLTDLVEKIVAAGHAKNVRLHYNSNGSIWPENLISYWQHFQQVDIHFSIDNVGSRFELERGGSWSHVQRNIHQLVEKNLPNLKISLMPTVNIMNVLYLEDVFNWADNLGIEVVTSYLQRPEELSIENLTPTAKQMVLSKYQHTTRSEFQKLVKLVSNSSGSDGKNFVEYIQQLDKIRNQSFLNTHQEIAKAMGYIV